MKQPKGNTPQERAAYKAGYERGEKEGLKKAVMIIQLIATSTEEFADSILQNSKEAVELRKILTK